jgi:predicted nucleotidyltransferase
MFTQLLERIALGLEQRQIPYMIIGGQAVLIYGEPRLTRDIDVTLGVGPERLPDLIAFAQASTWRLLVESPEEFVRRTMVLPCLDEESGIRIDFIFSHSAYEQQAMERVRRVEIGKASVRFAAPEDVIVHKVIAGRPRDLEDARSILLKISDLDRGYIRQWLAEFDRSLGESYLRAFEELAQSVP